MFIDYFFLKKKKGLSVFHPFQPMLCERIPINNCLKVLNTSIFYIENKLDGERIQLHMKNGEFQYWSRYNIF